jgi:hypothetical protein
MKTKSSSAYNAAPAWREVSQKRRPVKARPTTIPS